MKREFLQLAHNSESYPHMHLGGWLMSEKLDGQRAWWDGGITRGLNADEVPWANVEKDARLQNRSVATGLWSRYGKVIHAPDAWLNNLPFMSLDGELYLGRGRHQELRSAIGKHIPIDSEWGNVDFMVFDSPAPALVLQDGTINNPNFSKSITQDHLIWFLNRFNKMSRPGPKFACEVSSPFSSRYDALKIRVPQGSFAKVLKQIILPWSDWKGLLEEKLQEVISLKGEGLIVRHPDSLWLPKRTKDCLKIKPGLDSEAEVIGYTWGRETDKGSKLLGKMGAMIVKWTATDGINVVTFELSGFTDDEREMRCLAGGVYYDGYFNANEGKNCSEHWTNPKFPIGSKVTFLYRELTDAGIPKEARFYRKRDAE